MRLPTIAALFITVVVSHAEPIAMWVSNRSDDPGHYRYYIDSERLKKLKEVDLLKESPPVGIGKAAKIAISHMTEIHPNAKFTLGQITFYATAVGDDSLSMYEVMIYPHEDKDVPGPWTVHVLMDGGVLKCLKEEIFRKKFPKAYSKMLFGDLLPEEKLNPEQGAGGQARE